MDNLLTSFSMKKKIPNKFENCAIKFVCSVFEQIKKRTQYMKGPPKKKGKFETYLLLRQYPLYNKTESPAVLAPHFNDDEFQKSQAYGKDKAKFSIFSGLFGQFGSAMIHYGFYAWAWGTAGHFLARYGYDP